MTVWANSLSHAYIFSRLKGWFLGVKSEWLAPWCLYCCVLQLELSFTVPLCFRIAFLMKLHRSMCYLLSRSLYVSWRIQPQTGRQAVKHNQIKLTMACWSIKDKLCAILMILALLSNEKHQYPALLEGVVCMLKMFPSFPQPDSHEVPWRLPCVCICERQNETCIYYLSLLLL